MERVENEVIRANNALVALLIVFSYVPGVKPFLVMHLGSAFIDRVFSLESATLRVFVMVYSLVVSVLAFVAYLTEDFDTAINFGAYWLVVTFMSWAYMTIQEIITKNHSSVETV